jgi:psiF repeat
MARSQRTSAQTTPAQAPRPAASLECSMEADSKELHGQERKKFMSDCKKDAKALNEGFLPGNAGFLLRHMPDAHLKFCLACPHGGSLR